MIAETHNLIVKFFQFQKKEEKTSKKKKKDESSSSSDDEENEVIRFSKILIFQENVMNFRKELPRVKVSTESKSKWTTHLLMKSDFFLF